MPDEITYAARTTLGGGVTKAELTNGMTVLVRENHAAPVATVRCFVRNTGSVFEGRFLGSGISHMLEHLVAMGTTDNRSEEEVQRLLDSPGGRTNASTSSDRTAYYIDCPARRVDLAIELLADSLQNSAIPQSEYLREMGVIQRELEMGQANRHRMLFETMKLLVYIEHPMRHPTIGYLPVVRATTRDDVVAFYRERYVPQNMVFVVVGDVDTDHVLECVQANFQGFARTTERITVLPDEPEQVSPRSARREMAGETTHFLVGWPTVALQHSDLYPLDLISDVLTSGDSSRLGRRLRIEQPLAVTAESVSYTPGFVRGWFGVYGECRPENLAACREIILEEIARLQSDPVGPEELAKAKRQKTAAHVFHLQTAQAQASSLASGFLLTGDPQFDDAYVRKIQGVSADQVREVARRYFLADRQNSVVIDPLGRSRETADEVQAEPEAKVQRRTLDNGLTLLIKRHAVTPIVSVQAFVQAGVLADTADNSGLAALASQLMLRGTEKYSGQQIAEYFDAAGGHLVTDSQRSTSYLQCAVLKEDFQAALDYVHQSLFHPTFPEDEFEKAQRKQLDQIAARKASARTEIMDFWTTHLPKNSPYSRTVDGTPETVARLTTADCRAFHRAYFVPNNMVLAVFGDVDPESTWTRLQEMFGGEPASTDLALPRYPHEHTELSPHSAHLTSERENTAMVLVSYPTVRIQETKTQDVLDVLGSLLTGGGGAGGRLFHELRGQRLVYYVFGRSLSGPAPGFYCFFAQTQPETKQEVIQRIEACLQQIAEQGIPQAEFELAKEKLVVAHTLRNTTPAAQAYKAAMFELYGLGYDHDDDYDERIRAVTVENVQQALRKHFRVPIIVTSSPSSPSNARIAH